MTPTNLLSMNKEIERARELDARMAALGLKAPDVVKPSALTDSPWKAGFEPMPFDEFCLALDGSPMYPRQAQVWGEANMLCASQILDPKRTRTEFVLTWGKRGGKGFLSSKLIAYLPYILSALKEDPCTWMARTANIDLASGTRMDIVNVAPNEDLALQVFFNYLKRHLSQPLFKDFNIYPKPDRWSPGTNEIIFPDIDLHLYSKTSKSSGLDGYNLLAFIMDEADAFLDSAKKSNAEEIHSIFRRTAISTFGPFALGCVISWPRFEEGFQLRLEARARANPDLFIADRATTPDLRPNFSMDSPEIVEEVQNDPRGARAMYLCEPMSVGDAWIEFPEKIEEANDPTLVPVAYTSESTVKRFVLAKQKEVEYVSVILDSCNPIPGYQYFISIDAAESGDAYAVNVMHTDATNDAAEWLCPSCGYDPATRKFARYEKLLSNRILAPLKPGQTYGSMAELEKSYLPALNDIKVRCGVCGLTPAQVNLIAGAKDWYQKIGGGTSDKISHNGREFPLPHVYEDLLIQIQPHRATRHNEADLVVDLPAMEALVLALLQTIQPVMLRCDKHELATMVQRLANETGMDVGEAPFSNPEQFRRARLFKAMLYAGLLSFIPHAVATREIRRLQRAGPNRVDHPEGAGESKDCYDARALNVWYAATYANQELSVYF